jgi:hypothetical protein
MGKMDTPGSLTTPGGNLFRVISLLRCALKVLDIEFVRDLESLAHELWQTGIQGI